jgi:hypothetical protein
MMFHAQHVAKLLGSSLPGRSIVLRFVSSEARSIQDLRLLHSRRDVTILLLQKKDVS